MEELKNFPYQFMGALQFVFVNSCEITQINSSMVGKND